MKQWWTVFIAIISVALVLSSCARAPAPTATPAPTTSQTPMSAPTPEEVELKYDDGTDDGSSSAGVYGFLVHFSPPATTFTINEVKVFTSLRGTGYEERKPKLEIWNKDYNVLYASEEPYTSFSSEPGWVTIEIPKITVNDDFYVVFYTNSRRENGIYIHYDSSVINKHSEMATGSEVVDWVWESIPEDKTNWMISVMGTATNEAFKLALTEPLLEPLLEYTVTIENPESHLAHVSLTMSNIHGSKIDLRIRPIAETTVDHDKPFIKEITVTSKHGRILSGPYFERGEWSIVLDTEGANTVTIDYTVEQLLLDPHGAYESYIGEDFAVIVPNTLLLYPKSSEVKGTIHFIGPDGWNVSSVWEEVKTDLFSFDGVGELDNFVAFGPFNSRIKKIDELEVMLSIFEGVESRVNLDELFQVIEDLTQYYSQAFKPLDKEKLHWIVVSDPITGGGSRKESFLVSTARIENFWDIFTHEYVHLWNGEGVGVDPIWLREGATVFLTFRALVDIGTISEDARNDKLLRDWQTYLDLIASGEDKAVSTGVRPDPNINYTKGHLVTYALDLFIQDITKGDRDFLDITRYLAANYWGNRFSNDDLLQAVNHVTGTDLSDFFSKYVYGTEKLPLQIMDDTLVLER